MARSYVSIYEDIGRQFHNYAEFLHCGPWEVDKRYQNTSGTITKVTQNQACCMELFFSATEATTIKIQSLSTPYNFTYYIDGDAATHGINNQNIYTVTIPANKKIYFNVLVYTSNNPFDFQWKKSTDTTWNHVLGARQFVYGIEATIDENWTREGKEIAIGQTLVSQCKIKIKNAPSPIDFNHPFRIFTKLTVGNSTSTALFGKYWPKEIKKNDDGSVEILAYDDLIKLDAPYTPSFPVTAETPRSPKTIAEDILSQFHISGTTSNLLDGYIRDNNQLIHKEATYRGGNVGCYTYDFFNGEFEYEDVDEETGLPSIRVYEADVTGYFGMTVDEANNKVISFSTPITLLAGHKYCLYGLRKWDDDETSSRLCDYPPTPVFMNGDELIDIFQENTYIGRGYHGEDIGQTYYCPSVNTTVDRVCMRMPELAGYDDYPEDGLGVIAFDDAGYTYTVQLVDLTQRCVTETITIPKVEYSTGESTDFLATQIRRGGTLLDSLVEGTAAEQLGWMAGLSGYNAIMGDYNCYFAGFVTYNTAACTFGRTKQKFNTVHLDELPTTIGSLTSGTEKNVIVAGTGKGLTFYNPYMTQVRLNSIWAEYSAHPTQYPLTYYTGEFETFGNRYPLAGKGIKVTDKDGTQRLMCVTNMTTEINNGFGVKCESIGNTEAIVNFDTSEKRGTLTQKISSLQETQRDLSNLINSAEGGCISWIDNNNDGINDGLRAANNSSNPTKYLVLNYNGIGLSNDGSSIYQNAITQDGIVATAITSGTLRLGGTSDTTILEIYDTSNNKIGTWNKNGLKTEGCKAFPGPYTQTDLDRIVNIILGSVTPTAADYAKYDFYDDGEINVTDSILARNCKNNGGGLTLYWYVDILPTENNPFQVKRKIVYTNGTSTTTNVCKIGANQIKYGDGNEYYVSSSGQTKMSTVWATSYMACGDSSRMNEYNLSVWGSGVWAQGAYVNGSLEEYKQDITPAEDMLEKVKNSDVYKYNMKSEMNNALHKEHYGFVIGDNYRTPDEVVSAEGNGVDTYSMVAVLWKAVQELSAEVDELKQRLGDE